MTKAFEIRCVRPADPPKSGCGVPPQSVQEASRLPSSAPKLTISRLNRIQGVWESRPHSSSPRDTVRTTALPISPSSFQHFSFSPTAIAITQMPTLLSRQLV